MSLRQRTGNQIDS